MSFATQRPRATRYQVTTALLFRTDGSAEWRCGRLLDISGTGARWEASEPLPDPATPVQFVLPLMAAVGATGPLVCGVGRVARITRVASGDAATGGGMAVVFAHYEIVRVPWQTPQSLVAACAREPEMDPALTTE
jgi:hypothetical protein